VASSPDPVEPTENPLREFERMGEVVDRPHPEREALRGLCHAERFELSDAYRDHRGSTTASTSSIVVATLIAFFRSVPDSSTAFTVPTACK